MTKKNAIGLSKQNKIKVDPTKPSNKLNTLTVFADVPAGTSASAIKYAYLSSSTHIWDQPGTAVIGTIPTTTPIPANIVTVQAFCLRRRAKKSTLRTVSGDDGGDLTITLVFDDGGSDVVDECTIEDVEYDN